MNAPLRFTFHGSHGSITVDAAGKVVSREDCTDAGCDCLGEYRRITSVSLLDWAFWARETFGRVPSGADILSVGLYYDDGSYEPPASDYRNRKEGN